MFEMFENWSEQNNEAASSKSSSSPSSDSYSQSSNYSSLAYSNNGPGVGDFLSRKTMVLSVGGSVFFQERPKTTAIAKFCETINSLVNEGYAFVIVVGGGKPARTYQAAAKSLGANNFELDEVGIATTKLNALLFTYNIDYAWKDVLSEVKISRKVLSFGRIPIFSGTVSGQTTDAVAASIAEYLNCDFINLSNVDGIYASDPNKVQGTKMFDELTHVKMVSLLKAIASKPGAHTFVDFQAASILNRSKIRSFFVNGADLENFKSLVRGQEFKGTTVITESNPSFVAITKVKEAETEEDPLEEEDKEIDPKDIDF
jgi:uridylate kinase